MTFDEEQEISILEILNLETKRISSSELSSKIHHIIGNSWAAIDRMTASGLIKVGYLDAVVSYKDSFAITEAGKNKIVFLKKKKRNETIRKYIGITTLILAAISAYGVFKSPSKADTNKMQLIQKKSTHQQHIITQPKH